MASSSTSSSTRPTPDSTGGNDLNGAHSALSADRQAFASVKCETITPAVEKLLKLIVRALVRAFLFCYGDGPSLTIVPAAHLFQHRKVAQKDALPLVLVAMRLHQGVLGPIGEVAAAYPDVRLSSDMKRRVDALSTWVADISRCDSLI